MAHDEKTLNWTRKWR